MPFASSPGGGAREREIWDVVDIVNTYMRDVTLGSGRRSHSSPGGRVASK